MLAFWWNWHEKPQRLSSVDLVHKCSKDFKSSKMEQICRPSLAPPHGRHSRFQLLCFVLIHPKGNTLCGCWGQWTHVNVNTLWMFELPLHRLSLFSLGEFTNCFSSWSLQSPAESNIPFVDWNWLKLPGTASSVLCWKIQSLFLRIFSTSARVPSFGDLWQRGWIEIVHKLAGRRIKKSLLVF